MGDTPEADRIQVEFNDLDQICIYKIIFLRQKYKDDEQHLNIIVNNFEQVEAQVFYEDITERQPLVFKEEISERQHSYKLSFQNKRNDD